MNEVLKEPLNNMVPGHIRPFGKRKKKINNSDLKDGVEQEILFYWQARFELGNHFSGNVIKR